MKKISPYILSLFLVFLAALGVLSVLAKGCRWDEFLCTHIDIDIHTGDVKKSHYGCFLHIWDNIEMTDFSRRVRKYINIEEEPEWKRVRTDSYLYETISDTPYNSAVYACELFEKYIEKYPISEDEQKQLLRFCLEKLEQGNLAAFVKEIQDRWLKKLEQPSAMEKQNAEPQDSLGG